MLRNRRRRARGRAHALRPKEELMGKEKDVKKENKKKPKKSLMEKRAEKKAKKGD